MPRKQSPKAFLELVEPIRDALYAHAQRTVWRKDQVADVVQEALMTAWREFHRFEMGTNFRAWMFRILINTVFRFNKRNARRREVVMAESSDVMAIMQREETWVGLLERPDALMQLLDERLVRSLERLGGDERQCLLLRVLEEFTYKEIASMLSLPVGTVMSHVHRARIKLREQLAGLAVEEGLIQESLP